jgi:sigma-B regulation protein RsbU (phosphoserine phosphatase)
MMASLEASLRGLAMAGENLAELMSRVNRFVYEASAANRYATFFYANYDPRSRNIAYVNAGHNPPIVLRKSAPEPQPIRLDRHLTLGWWWQWPGSDDLE